MTILKSELKFFKSKVVSDDDSNGGRMSTVEVVSGVVNNIWPNVLSAERTAGWRRYRKVFAKNTNDNDEMLLDSDMWNDIATPAGDWIVMFPSDQTETQADFKNYTGQIYAAVNIAADIASGVSTFDLALDDASQADAFPDGMAIRLTNKAKPDETTGNEDLLTISGTPSLVGTTLTVTVAETVGADYTVAGGSRCMSLYNAGNVVAVVDPVTVTSAAGTYDDTAYPLLADNIATVEDVFTLTFTDATHFTAVGTYEGNVGSGDTGSDFSPTNADFTKPFFTMVAAGWGGTFVAGDTVTVPTHPAAVPIVLDQHGPAGTPSLSGNINTTAWSGESA